MERICIICGKPVPDGSDLMDRFGVHHDIHASCWPEVARLTAELTEGKREAEYLANLLWERCYKKESPNFKMLNTIAGVVSQINNMIAGLVEERDQALARAAAAAGEMRERAAEAYEDGFPEWDTFSAAASAIRALPIPTDAKEALDKLLAKAREDAIREASQAMKPMLRSMISRGQASETILALLNEGEQNE